MGHPLFVLVFIARGFVFGFRFGISFIRLIGKGPLAPNVASCSKDPVALIVIATGVMALVERKALFSLWLSGNSACNALFSGLFWGFVAISALVLACGSRACSVSTASSCKAKHY